MTLKKHIFLTGLLLLLPFISGCLAVTIRDDPFGRNNPNPLGNYNSSALRGWVFKHVRIPYIRHYPPALSMRDISLPYNLDILLQVDAFSKHEPYTTDLHNTRKTDIQGSGTIFHIQEPISGYNLYIELNSNAIGDIAKKHGLTKVYFADLEIFEVLGGIWQHQKLHIYGEK